MTEFYYHKMYMYFPPHTNTQTNTQTNTTIPPNTQTHGPIREYNLVLYTYIFNALTVFELSNIAFHT